MRDSGLMATSRPTHTGTSRAHTSPDQGAGLRTVGAVAALAGISVRTLHHWDSLGLVQPSGRSWSEYRLYSDADIARIHRVLVYRELGFTLAQIADLLDDPTIDEQEHLRRQRDLLSTRISHLQEMVSAVDRMMEVHTMGIALTPAEQSEIFGTDWDPAWQEEAAERWGDSPQWEQSQERSGSMSKAQWKQVAAEAEALGADLAAAKRSGVAAGSVEAAQLAERHRASISQFYDCSHSMQVLLARMYLQDSRFSSYYDRHEPGLTTWLAEVIEANARTHGIDPDSAVWE